MAGKVKTYNPKEVTIACGSHIVSGIADDSFVSIEPNGEGISKKVGCDGEIVRSVSPDNTFKVKISLLQTSEGMFPVLIKDLKGGTVFSTESAWVTKKASLTRGKADNNREWEIDTGDATLSE